MFSFSRKECELYALGLKGVDFNGDPEEKEYIAQVCVCVWGGGGSGWGRDWEGGRAWVVCASDCVVV